MRPPGTSALAGIGDTPVFPLRRVVPPGHAEVWVKVESGNPTGSYKDRMALSMISGAEQRGDLRPGMTVVEFTGGSTGSSLAFVCAVKGYRFHAVSSDAFAKEKLDAMRAFGAELEVLPSDGGRITPDLFVRMRERTMVLAAQPGTFWTNQFNNGDALLGYEGIGVELLEQLGESITTYCGAVGTAGMLMGVGRALRRVLPAVRIVAFEPDGSPVLTTGRAGSHRVEGIGTGAVPPKFDRAFVSDIRAVSEGDARALARRLAAEEGVFGGTSSAINVLGALTLAGELGRGRRVVTVIVDSGLKYLAGDLYARPTAAY
ncbi:MAG TPA: cysteine synthase family protein [Vicinamibacterales bacterium]